MRLAPLAHSLSNPDEIWILEEETKEIKGLLKVRLIFLFIFFLLSILYFPI